MIMDFRKAVKASEGFLKRSIVTGRYIQCEQTVLWCGGRDGGMNGEERVCVRDVDR